MRSRLRLLAVTLLIVAACGGGGQGGSISTPCDLADADLVQSVFGGTVSEGVEGQASDCDFEVEGGPVLSVGVFHYGRAEGWEGIRDGFQENRGGVTDVEGIGDDAFFPNDFGARELVVQSGGEVFSVTVFTGFDDTTVEAINGVADLAKAIADDLTQ